jgi:MSHA biogenesis protein MshK
MATGLKRSLTALLLCATQVALAADPLPDPTRPAIDLNDTGSGGAVVEVAPEEASRGLQSIIISPQYRAAIINGETVQLGDKAGDSRLVEVRENSVVLENSQGRRVVELFPKVNIKKNETAQQNKAVQKNASVRTSLPENAAGGAK